MPVVPLAGVTGVPADPRRFAASASAIPLGSALPPSEVPKLLAGGEDESESESELLVAARKSAMPPERGDLGDEMPSPLAYSVCTCPAGPHGMVATAPPGVGEVGCVSASTCG